jgi:predicted lactoylglutathione lyase
VHDFYKIAIANGATCDGPPGPRPLYSDAYYGCFVRDLDGHKIEATFWDENLAPH